MKRRRNQQQPLHKIDRQVDTNNAAIQAIFADSMDIQSQQITFGSPEMPCKVLFVYSTGMSDIDRFHRDILPSFYTYFLQWEGLLSAQQMKETLPIAIQATEQFYEPLISHLFHGLLVFFVDGIDIAYVVDLADPPKREPEEPGNELSVRGPKDGFVEELAANVALVRKRLPTDSLCSELFTVGTRSQTKVSLLYIRDIIDPTVLKEVRDRIQSIQTDALYTSAQLEGFLSELKFKLVPMFSYSGRPDFVTGSLLRGRFAIILDGTPTAILGPVNLPFLFQSAEDEYMLYPFLVLQRSLRIIGVLVTLLLPGLYVGVVGYHVDRIPLTLLGTLITAHRGIPFPTPMETVLMLVMFELLREAGTRLPSGLGQTLGVVGGLIIGESAIEAGLTSPIVVVITGTTAVASFTISNQQVAGFMSIFRLFILVLSSVFGEYGFLIGTFTILIYLSTVRSFGVPYLSPFSPLRTRDLSYTFTSVTLNQARKRPTILRTKDQTRE